MSQHLHQAFGNELVAQRRAAFEAQAQHNSLVRQIKLARREHALAARANSHVSPPIPALSAASAAQPARARCAADLG